MEHHYRDFWVVRIFFHHWQRRLGSTRLEQLTLEQMLVLPKHGFAPRDMHRLTQNAIDRVVLREAGAFAASLASLQEPGEGTP